MPISHNAASKTMFTLIRYALTGFGPVCSVEELACSYEGRFGSKKPEEMVGLLIEKELSEPFSRRTVSQLSPWISLPVAVSPAVSLTWIASLRLSLVVSRFYGLDIRSRKIQFMAYMILVGDSLRQTAFRAGIIAPGKFRKGGWKTGDVVNRINQVLGYSLLTRLDSGMIRLNRIIPVVAPGASDRIDNAGCMRVVLASRAVFAEAGARKKDKPVSGGMPGLEKPLGFQRRLDQMAC